MNKATIAGLVILGLPMVVFATVLFWRSQRAIVAFALALITVGLGYLAASGAAGDVARSIPMLRPWIAESPIVSVPASQSGASPTVPKADSGDSKPAGLMSQKPAGSKDVRAKSANPQSEVPGPDQGLQRNSEPGNAKPDH